MDLGRNIKQVTALAAATLAATGNGLVIDTQGFESLAFLITIGDFVTFDGTNNLTWKVQKGAASDGSDAADIAAAEYLENRYESGAAWADRKNDAAADDEETFLIGVRLDGSARYYRLVVTEAGTVSVPASAVALLGSPRHAPATATQAP
jgi:hypothetical protein